MNTKSKIYAWMKNNAHRFVDHRTGEVDYTRMVETWDIETQNGGVTTDPDHEAWDIALSF